MRYLFVTSFLFLLVSVAVFAQKITKEFQGTWYINNMSTDGGRSYVEFATPKTIEVDSDKIILGIDDNKDSVTLNIDSVEQIIDEGHTAYLIWFQNDGEVFEVVVLDDQNWLLVIGDITTQQELGRFNISRTKLTPPAHNKPQVEDVGV
jgi:hypothetical protein